MASSFKDFFIAVDKYLQSNGKGSGGNTIAQKINNLFDNTKSPLSLKSGSVLEKLYLNMNSFADSIALNEIIINDLGKDIINTGVSKNFTKINTGIGKFIRSMDAMSSAAGNVTSKLSAFKIKGLNTRPAISGAGIADAFSSRFTSTRIDTNTRNGVRYSRALDVNLSKNSITNFLNEWTIRSIYIGKNIPMQVSIHNIDEIIARWTNRLSTEKLQTQNPNGTLDTKNLLNVRIMGLSDEVSKSIRQLSGKSNKDSENSGGLFGRIFGTFASGIALFGTLAGLNYLLNNTPVGGMIKNFLWAGIDLVWENREPIGEFLYEQINGVYNLVTGYFKNLFNLLGLKDRLGKEGEGTAVFLTRLAHKIIGFFDTKFLGGLGGKIANSVKSIAKLPETILQKIGGFLMGDQIKQGLDTVMKEFSKSWNVKNLITGTKTLFKGAGLTKIAGYALSLVGKVTKLLKFIPGLGAIISFYSAYQRFSAGDYVGGLIELGGAIPVVGWGFMALNMYLDAAKSEEKKSWNASIGDFLGKAGDWIMKNVKNIPLIGGLVDIGVGIYDIIKGDYKKGFEEIFNGLFRITPFGWIAEAYSAITAITENSDDSSSKNILPNKGNSIPIVQSIMEFFTKPIDAFVGFIKELSNSVIGKLASMGKSGILDTLWNFSMPGMAYNAVKKNSNSTSLDVKSKELIRGVAATSEKTAAVKEDSNNIIYAELEKTRSSIDEMKVLLEMYLKTSIEGIAGMVDASLRGSQLVSDTIVKTTQNNQRPVDTSISEFRRNIDRK